MKCLYQLHPTRSLYCGQYLLFLLILNLVAEESDYLPLISIFDKTSGKVLHFNGRLLLVRVTFSYTISDLLYSSLMLSTWQVRRYSTSAVFEGRAYSENLNARPYTSRFSGGKVKKLVPRFRFSLLPPENNVIILVLICKLQLCNLL